MKTKLCECGCGQDAPLAPFNNATKGWVKGQPLRFIHGHNAKGKPNPRRGESRRPVEERFWEYVDKKSPNECWLWKGTIGTHGYGSIGIGEREYRAHRLSYEINISPIPKGLYVLHKCDNPSCVNPKHLWVGTQQDNMTDMKMKGRSTKYRKR